MASLRTYPPYIDMAVCRTGEKFTKYAVLGDDVVIADQEVARVYEQSLDQLRVPLFKNPKFPGSVEFAKKEL